MECKMSEEQLRESIIEKLKQEEAEFDIWFLRIWGHIKEAEHLCFAYDLFRSVALSAWRKRGLGYAVD